MQYRVQPALTAESQETLEGYLCVSCHQPLERQDFVDLGLPLPEPGEEAPSYVLRAGLDALIHADCQFGCVPGDTSC